MLVPPLLRAGNSLQIHWRTIHYFLHLLSWTLELSLLRVFRSNRFWCSGQVLHQKKHLEKTDRLCEKFTTLRTRLNLKGWVLIQSLEIKGVKLATLSPLLLRKLGPFGPRSPLQSTKTTSFTNDYLLLFFVASILVFRMMWLSHNLLLWFVVRSLGPYATKTRNLVHGPYMGPYIIPNLKEKFWIKNFAMIFFFINNLWRLLHD